MPMGWKPNQRFVSFFEVFVWYSGVRWGGVITYMLRCCKFSCTFISTSCYAAANSLALPYIRHATLLQVLLHFPTYVMLRCCKFSCTSIHTYMLQTRVKKKWRNKVAAAVVWQKLSKNGRPKFPEKIWRLHMKQYKKMVFVGRKTRSETRPIETWIR